MNVILELIQKFLGLGGGGAVNAAGGIVNHTLLLAGAGWAWAHWEEPVAFSASVGTCALVAGAIYIALEIMRRSRPGP